MKKKSCFLTCCDSSSRADPSERGIGSCSHLQVYIPKVVAVGWTMKAKQNKSLAKGISDPDTLVGPSVKAVCKWDAPAMGCPGDQKQDFLLLISCPSKCQRPSRKLHAPRQTSNRRTRGRVSTVQEGLTYCVNVSTYFSLALAEAPLWHTFWSGSVSRS